MRCQDTLQSTNMLELKKSFINFKFYFPCILLLYCSILQSRTDNTIPTLGVNNLLLLYLDMIIYSYEKGSLMPCPSNEGVPPMSKSP